jgi:site-specific DNA recombinase
VEVQKSQLTLTLKPADETSEPEMILIAWQKPPFRRFRDVLVRHGTTRECIRVDRTERRARLVAAMARGRRWLDEIVAGTMLDAEQMVKRERCTVRQVNLTLSLAFLAPQLVKAAVEGRLPRGWSALLEP